MISDGMESQYEMFICHYYYLGLPVATFKSFVAHFVTHSSIKNLVWLLSCAYQNGPKGSN